jgi:glutamate formiminotransferase
MAGLVECVPNFSEGRDQAKIDQIIDSITGVDGINNLVYLCLITSLTEIWNTFN